MKDAKCDLCGGSLGQNAPTPKTLKKRLIGHDAICSKCFVDVKHKRRTGRAKRNQSQELTAKAAAVLTKSGMAHILENGNYRAYIDNLSVIEAKVEASSANIERLKSKLAIEEHNRKTHIRAIEVACELASAVESLCYPHARAEANKAISNKGLRLEVFSRDRKRCRHCGTSRDLTIDHIVPVRFGGDSSVDNLQTLCRSCNSRKGSKVTEGAA